MPEPAALLTAAVLAALDSTSANASFQRYPDPSSAEQCQRRAQFASLSRTLACLVNEHLVEAAAVECDGRYFGVASSEHADHSVGSSTSAPRDCAAESIIFELLYRPLSTRAAAAAATTTATTAGDSDAISWIDPSELTHKIVCVSNDHRVVPITSSAELISIFGRWTGIESALIESICDEYANSDRNMAFAYANSPLSKTPSLRDSPPIEWEQSLLEGHPTYPIHKNRYAVPPMPPQPASLEMELYSPTIRFAAVPKSDVIVGGDYTSIIRELFAAFFDDAHQHLLDDDSVAIVPVHSVHLPVVKALFPDVQLLPESCSAAALGMSSMRSVVLKSGSSRYSIKFPLSIRISSVPRGIHPLTIKLFDWLNDLLEVFVKTTSEFGGSMIATPESAYAVSTSSDHVVSRNLACMIRDSPEYYAALTGDAVVVCAALVEEQHPVHAIAAGADPNGPRLPLLHHIWREQLATADGKLAFLRDYTRKYLLAVLPSLLVHGFAFEAHGQNTMVRINPDTKEITGFIMRDYAGVRFHTETLVSSAQHANSKPVPEDEMLMSVVGPPKRERVYGFAHFVLIQSHLGSLIRALSLLRSDDSAVDGLGWRVIREELDKILPAEHLLRTVWLDTPTCSIKSFFKMKLKDMFIENLYTTIPNVLLYAGNDEMLI